MEGKRGAKGIFWILFIVAIAVTIFSAHLVCKITPSDIEGAKNSSAYVNRTILWLKINVAACETKDLGIIATSKNLIKDLFGFNESFYDFLGDLMVGALVGLWLFFVYCLASLERLFLLVPFAKAAGYSGYSKRLKTSWLGLIGSSLWKIIPIAVAYAVIMQIPIINSFIKVITLEPLLQFKGTIWGSILKSFIIAFYIGFLPTAIEQYTRYKITRGYYAAIEREKAIVALEKVRLRGRG